MPAVPKPPTLVVVVAFHNTHDLRTCLSALGNWGELVVVDNGDDPEVEQVTERSAGRYVNPGRNLGFAAAVNQGLQFRRPAQDVLLLNPDARLTPNAADRLLETLAADAGVAAIAPSLVGADGSPQQTTWPIPSPREVWVDALGFRRWIAPRNQFIVGAVLLLRAEALDAVGHLDERFFLYAEECDWQLRAQRGGWRVLSTPDVVVQHAGGASSADSVRREVLFFRSASELGRKWYGRSGWLWMRIGSVVGAALRWLGARDRDRRREHALRLRIYTVGVSTS